ncbi:MAG: ribosome biogenesis GTPase YlqF [Anaerovibrio sp.]|uniref:ribosome biogenesis GTPase YlqF n=1 Tax=Anaerovibrio sp. TaxID=1872532 RepID=UPI0025CCDC93|nr:ribosome biogenesis GTPase YlqF [Anaerovibrio sp.]MCR5176463.1 ribosome biogenesis GTPase YlqF [Anaerovibrio sp.]
MEYSKEREESAKKLAAQQVLPNVQWFPGHMTKARRIITDNLKLVDVVIELLDARIPYSSANPMIQEIIADKPKVVALNKADLADPAATKEWIAYFKAKDIKAVAVDATQGRGIKQLVQLTEDLARSKTEKLVSKGAKPRAARVMILGIPNVGKSSLINRLAGSNKAKTADKPGVTRAKQWIRLGSQLELLDTPGILWPKFEDMNAGLKLAFTGAINDEAIDRELITGVFLETMLRSYPERLAERYKIKEELPDKPEDLLELIGRKRGCLLKGGIIDMEKAQRIVLTDFRSGKLGAISLDRPTDISQEKD